MIGVNDPLPIPVLWAKGRHSKKSTPAESHLLGVRV